MNAGLPKIAAVSDRSTLKAGLKAQWEAMAEDWISRLQDGETSHREAMLDGWMHDAVGDVSGRKVVDLGCGEGRFSRMLAERGAMVTGVDLCRPFIEYAKSHRVSDEVYLIGDMEDLHGVSSDEFDLAVSYITFVDVPDLRGCVRSLGHVLEWRYETQTIPQRPDRRTVGCSGFPTPISQDRWKATYCRPTGGRQRHCVRSAQRLHVASHAA